MVSCHGMESFWRLSKVFAPDDIRTLKVWGSWGSFCGGVGDAGGGCIRGGWVRAKRQLPIRTCGCFFLHVAVGWWHATTTHYVGKKTWPFLSGGNVGDLTCLVTGDADPKFLACCVISRSMFGRFHAHARPSPTNIVISGRFFSNC